MSQVFDRTVRLSAAEQWEVKVNRWVQSHPRPRINEICSHCKSQLRQFTVRRTSSGELAWFCTTCKEPHPYRPSAPGSQQQAGVREAAAGGAPPLPPPELKAEPPRVQLKHAAAELRAAELDLEQLARALPAARSAVDVAEADYEAAVAAREAASAKAAEQLEAQLRNPGGASPQPSPDVFSKPHAVEAAEVQRATAIRAKQLIAERETAARATLDRCRHRHRQAALEVIVAESASVAAERALVLMNELSATLAALGWCVSQRVRLASRRGGACSASAHSPAKLGRSGGCERPSA